MSLIVLNRIEDYVAYRITPPEELLKEYNELIEDEIREHQSDYDYRMQSIEYDFKERINWWKNKKNNSDKQYTPKENIFKN